MIAAETEREWESETAARGAGLKVLQIREKRPLVKGNLIDLPNEGGENNTT